MFSNKVLTLCVTIPTDSRHLNGLESIVRAVSSLIDVVVVHHVSSHVVASLIESMYDQGLITTVIATRSSLSEEHMLQVAVAAARTPYVVTLQRSGDVTADIISNAVQQIHEHDPFDVALPTSKDFSRFPRNQIRPTSGQVWRTKAFSLQHDPIRAVANTLPWFVSVITYGNFPEFTHRSINSVINETGFERTTCLVVGYSVTDKQILSNLLIRLQTGAIDTLIYSHLNLNKSGMHRVIHRLGRGDYLLSLDDDVTLSPGWLPEVVSFLEAKKSFDVAGEIYFINREGRCANQAPYLPIVERKPWWRGISEKDGTVYFARGACFLVRTEFVRIHNFPDSTMRIDLDDVLLSDLALQTGGSMVPFPHGLIEKIVIELAPRRGQHNQDGSST